jgi:hypothetical protein
MNTSDPESLAELLVDCRRMAPHWEVPVLERREKPAAVAVANLRGITVPAASALVVNGMAEYGD